MQHIVHLPLIRFLYTVIYEKNNLYLQFDFPNCIIKLSFIITIYILIPTIYPRIQFLLHVNVHHDIILTWEVHQEVGRYQPVICCDITTIMIPYNTVHLSHREYFSFKIIT